MNYSSHAIVEGARSYALWARLALNDIRLRSQRTILGPLWFSLSHLIFAAGLTFVFSSFFGSDNIAFFPYIAFGLAIWGFVSRCILESVNVYLLASAHIKQSAMSFTIHNYRLVYRNIIIFGHEMIVVVLALAYCNMFSLQAVFISSLGMLIVVVATFFLSCLVAVSCTRFPDISNAIELLVRFLFFLTPIFWYSRESVVHDLLLDWNPVNYALQVTRDPFVLGVAPSGMTWGIVVSILFVVGWLATAILSRYRHIVPLWV